MFRRRYRVVARSAPWIAAQDAPDGQPRAAEYAMRLDRLYGVLRAGGSIAAARWQHRRYARPVEIYRQQHQPAHGSSQQ